MTTLNSIVSKCTFQIVICAPCVVKWNPMTFEQHSASNVSKNIPKHFQETLLNKNEILASVTVKVVRCMVPQWTIIVCLVIGLRWLVDSWWSGAFGVFNNKVSRTNLESSHTVSPIDFCSVLSYITMIPNDGLRPSTPKLV